MYLHFWYYSDLYWLYVCSDKTVACVCIQYLNTCGRREVSFMQVKRVNLFSSNGYTSKGK